jgi:hypothetical protein
MRLLPHGETGAPVGVDVVSYWWDYFCLCADPVPAMASASATGLVGRDIHHFRVRGGPGRVDATRGPHGDRALPQEAAAAHCRRNRDREKELARGAERRLERRSIRGLRRRADARAIYRMAARRRPISSGRLRERRRGLRARTAIPPGRTRYRRIGQERSHGRIAAQARRGAVRAGRSAQGFRQVRRVLLLDTFGFRLRAAGYPAYALAAADEAVNARSRAVSRPCEADGPADTALLRLTAAADLLAGRQPAPAQEPTSSPAPSG